MGQDGSIIPLFGVATKGVSPVISAQRRVNVYVEMPKDGEKGPIAIYGRPGLSERAAVIGNEGGTGIVRGMMDGEVSVPDGSATVSVGVFAAGDYLHTVRSAPFGSGGVLNGQLLTADGRVSIARNNTQVIAVDGETGYVYTPASAAFATLRDEATAAGFPEGATTVAFLASRFVVNAPSSGRFYYSALNDGLTWSSLDYATAETSPDNLVAVWADNGELFLFGEYTTEFWAPSTGSAAFARIGGAAAQWGLAAVDSLKRVEGGTVFLGKNFAGERKVLVLRGYQATPISTPEIETVIQNEAQGLTSATAMSYSSNGHTFYKLSFDNLTLVYDMTTGLWSEDTTGAAGGRWIGKYGALVNGEFLVSHYAEAALHKLDHDANADYDEPIVAEIVTRHVFNDHDRVSVDALSVDMETGNALASGQGSDPMVMLQVSRDNGRTWGNEMWRSMGELGEYLTRVVWRRLGRSRDWLFRLRVSDPIRRVFAGGSIKVRP